MYMAWEPDNLLTEAAHLKAVTEITEILWTKTHTKPSLWHK